MCQGDTPELAFSRSFQQRFKLHHFLKYHVIFFHGWGTIRRFPDRVLSLEITRVFAFFRVPPPRSQSSFLIGPPVQLPGSSLTVYVSDATFEPGVHTWVSRRLCQIIPSDWMPPPSPCLTGSGIHTGWPLLIPLETSHSLANCRLNSRQIPSPPQDKSFIL